MYGISGDEGLSWTQISDTRYLVRESGTRNPNLNSQYWAGKTLGCSQEYRIKCPTMGSDELSPHS